MAPSETETYTEEEVELIRKLSPTAAFKCENGICYKIANEGASGSQQLTKEERLQRAKDLVDKKREEKEQEEKESEKMKEIERRKVKLEIC